MKLLHNNISPIPFYDSLDEVNSKNDYAFGNTYKNIVYYESQSNTLHIPSFVIHTLLPTTTNLTITLNIVNTKTGSIVFQIQNGEFDKIEEESLWTILFRQHDLDATGVTVPLGEYYFQVIAFDNVRNNYFYSDYVYITSDIHNYVKLEWLNDNNLYINKRSIPFESGFRPYCYVDALIGKPTYEYEEELTSRLGYDFIELQTSKKTYNFGFVAPEYLCDALRLMKVCNHKYVTRFDFPNYGTQYDIMNMGFEVDWEEQGDLAGVTLSFSINNVISNTSGYLPLGGDFNNDYNSDFNNV